MADLDLDAIKRDLDAVPPPPWRWIGRKDTGPLLVTDHSGQLYLHGPAHPVDEHGHQVTGDEDVPVFADLLFRDQRDDERYATMREAAEMIVPRTSYDPDTYRDIDNPMARWIVRSAAHATALLAEVEELRGQLADIEARVHRAFVTSDEHDVTLDALTVDDLTRLIMHAIRDGGDQS